MYMMPGCMWLVTLCIMQLLQNVTLIISGITKVGTGILCQHTIIKQSSILLKQSEGLDCALPTYWV